MKKQLLSILVPAVLVLGCSRDDAVAPADQPTYKNGVTEKIITFKQSSGTLEVIACADCPTGLQMYVSGSGVATHLGNFTVINTVCFDPVTGGGVGDHLGFLTAANGDQLFTQMVYGPYYPEGPDGPVYYDYVVLGGTGRFGDVTGGAFVMYGTIDYTDFTWDLQGGGPIYFD